MCGAADTISCFISNKKYAVLQYVAFSSTTGRLDLLHWGCFPYLTTDVSGSDENMRWSMTKCIIVFDVGSHPLSQMVAVPFLRWIGEVLLILARCIVFRVLFAPTARRSERDDTWCTSMMKLASVSAVRRYNMTPQRTYYEVIMKKVANGAERRKKVNKIRSARPFSTEYWR